MKRLYVYADFDWLPETEYVGELGYESLRGSHQHYITNYKGMACDSMSCTPFLLEHAQERTRLELTTLDYGASNCSIMENIAPKCAVYSIFYLYFRQV